MQTLLDVSHTQASWLVKLVAGLPGGIGNTRAECGGITAPLGQIENSRLRVLRMIGTMAVGGDASANDLNAFNPVMNLGYRLSQWFTTEFGSTQCHAVTQCDFAASDGVERYISGGGVVRCSAIAEKVALKVQSLMERPAI